MFSIRVKNYDSRNSKQRKHGQDYTIHKRRLMLFDYYEYTRNEGLSLHSSSTFSYGSLESQVKTRVIRFYHRSPDLPEKHVYLHHQLGPTKPTQFPLHGGTLGGTPLDHTFPVVAVKNGSTSVRRGPTVFDRFTPDDVAVDGFGSVLEAVVGISSGTANR
jgi:hypothetical protein